MLVLSYIGEEGTRTVTEDGTTKEIHYWGFWNESSADYLSDYIFIYGANDFNFYNFGHGSGQAIVSKKSNAFGIPTKKKGCDDKDDCFYNDGEIDRNQFKIDLSIRLIRFVLLFSDKFKGIVVPMAYFGSGLSELNQRAQKTYQWLIERINIMKIQTAADKKQIGWLRHIDKSNFLKILTEIVNENNAADKEEKDKLPRSINHFLLNLLTDYNSFKNSQEGSRPLDVKYIETVNTRQERLYRLEQRKREVSFEPAETPRESSDIQINNLDKYVKITYYFSLILQQLDEFYVYFLEDATDAVLNKMTVDSNVDEIKLIAQGRTPNLEQYIGVVLNFSDVLNSTLDNYRLLLNKYDQQNKGKGGASSSRGSTIPEEIAGLEQVMGSILDRISSLIENMMNQESNTQEFLREIYTNIQPSFNALMDTQKISDISSHFAPNFKPKRGQPSLQKMHDSTIRKTNEYNMEITKLLFDLSP